MVATFVPLTVASVDSLCDDAAAVTFDVPDEQRDNFDFAAGQSLTLRRMIDGVEERRSYSICAPTGERPRIGVREIPDGLFSRWLVNDVRPGDVIDVQAPTGSFRAEPGGRHLCIAAGSGITPMISIIATVLRDPNAQVSLLYGNRTTGSVMFVDELADLKNRHSAQLDLVHVLSREPRDVELFSGRLEGERLRSLLTMLVPLEALDHVWLCGPFGMITEARELLTELGVAPDKVHAELFYVDEPPPDLVRVEAEQSGSTSDVTVTLDGKTSTTPMSRDVTVLDSAQKSRTDLPFACKGGVCGTCRAKVTFGQVEMRRNYALEEAEIADGFVLTCQSLPVSEDVTVNFDA